MGRRGPAPTPTNILKLRGSTLVTERRLRSEVKGPIGHPDCPAWLDEDARAMWDKLIPQLSAMGILSRIDGNALARYCRFWSRWKKAEDFITERGEMYPIKDDQGNVKCFQQWPQVANVIDYDVIRRRINELNQRFGIREIAIDPWNATQLSVQLQGDGLEVVTFGQGFKDMTAPSKELEKLVMSGKLRHGGHPVLRWMASNVAVETDAAGNLKPSKKKSTERIDGIVATVMGIGRMLLDEGECEAGIMIIG